MASMTLVVQLPRPSSRGLLAVVLVLGGLVLAVLISLALPFFDHDTGGDRAHLSTVDLGLPFAWVHEDQTARISRPYPSRVGMDSPLESITTFSPGAFLADVLVIFAGVASAGGGAVVLARRARRSARV